MLFRSRRAALLGGLLAAPGWIPAAPAGLAGLRLRAASRPPRYPRRPAPAHLLPARPGGGRYPGYAAAVAALDPPAVFENRPVYQLTAASLAGTPELCFAPGRYFDGTSLGQAVAHELAAAWLRAPGRITLAGLPLRADVGDPCDLTARPATVAVSTLTLRREPGGAASFLLHWRDPAKVAHAAGVSHVVPAGIFQPAAGTAASATADFDLWRCMVREFAEELLGAPEACQLAGGAVDYPGWPLYRQLTAARETGQAGVYCLGAGVDPLTFATDILTVAVFDAAVFDTVFGALAAANAEGRLLTVDGSPLIPFTAAWVARFAADGAPVQAAGAALLHLAWQHRAALGCAGPGPAGRG